MVVETYSYTIQIQDLQTLRGIWSKYKSYFNILVILKTTNGLSLPLELSSNSFPWSKGSLWIWVLPASSVSSLPFSPYPPHTMLVSCSPNTLFFAFVLFFGQSSSSHSSFQRSSCSSSSSFPLSLDSLFHWAPLHFSVLVLNFLCKTNTLWLFLSASASRPHLPIRRF